MLEFSASGKYVKEIGHNMYGFLVPQSVRIDAKDNIWAVDNYSGMLMEFDPTGSKILMTMGRKPESIDIPEPPPRAPRGGGLPGAGAQQDLFEGLADVAWDAQGNIFVADGIGNAARVAKFTPDGMFVKSFGSKGSDNDKFAGPSSIQVDASGNVYVADPGNHRIQVLDNNLNYKSSITGVGDPSALCISSGAHQYLSGFSGMAGSGGRVLHGVSNAFHSRKGKPVERRRRKTMGLRRRHPFRIQTPMVARLPKGPGQAISPSVPEAVH
jgi:hypothetical protein